MQLVQTIHAMDDGLVISVHVIDMQAEPGCIPFEEIAHALTPGLSLDE
jgi:hypothetical protein